MAYLTLQDYYRYIQPEVLTQLINGQDAYRLDVEAASLAEVKSYLTKKFDIADEFRDTNLFSYSDTFKAKQLVYLNATAYNPATTYTTGQLTLQAGNVYYSIAGNTPAAFNPAQWTLIGAQYAYFYIPTPYPEFNLKQVYTVGDIVFWKNKVYRCLTASVLLDNFSRLQYGTYNAIPEINKFPDTTNTQWSAGVDYAFTQLYPNSTAPAAWSSVTAYTVGQRVLSNGIVYQAFGASTNVTPGTDITKWLPVSWTAGDNRSNQIVQKLTIISIYWMHQRIAPRNVPELRMDAYNAAIQWLDGCARGTYTLDAPETQPASGRRIVWGGTIKSNNNY